MRLEELGKWGRSQGCVLAILEKRVIVLVIIIVIVIVLVIVIVIVIQVVMTIVTGITIIIGIGIGHALNSSPCIDDQQRLLLQ